MRNLAILIFLTLDGVMQAPGDPDEDRSDDFRYGGWARDCWDEVMQQVMREARADPYDLLLGRTTFESFSDSFNNSDESNPVANKLNSAKKYVVTSSTEKLEWNNSQKITGDIESRISQLKAQDGPLLQVHGSWQLIQMLLKADLIDEFRLWTFPVIVGEGKRLFGQGSAPTKLKLLKTETCSCGAIMSIYEQANKNAM